MLIVIKDKFDVTGIRGEVLRRRIVHETRLELICFFQSETRMRESWNIQSRKLINLLNSFTSARELNSEILSEMYENIIRIRVDLSQ